VTDSPSLPDPRVGSILQGRYQILAAVASGGMGVVYRGERLQLGRPVAIKFLHPWVAAQPSFLQRFEVEARAMSRLSHPNCVSVIDFGVEGVPFLVMDFAAGRSLRLLLEGERLEQSRALGLARQILAGVAHAHGQGIIHRDLKPENIIVSDAAGLVDHVRILDFGLAKLNDGPALTVGLTIGTPSYMAPEQTLEEGVVDARSDLYSVGVLLFEMLTGRKPFASDKVAELILMHRSQPAPRLAPGAACSDALEAVVAKALAKRPADRFASADEMAAALEHVPEASARGAALPVAPPPPPLPGAAGEADRTLVDRRRHRAFALLWQRALLSLRSLPPRWHRCSRQQRWVAGGLAGAALAGLLVWVLWPGRARPLPAPLPPTPPPAIAPTPAATDDLAPLAPDNTPGLAEAADLLRSGQREPAIASLLEIRRRSPHSAYANFLLAVAYFEKLWWSIGLQHAQAAIAAEPAYRRSPTLARLLVHSLMSDAFWEKAAGFLDQDLAEISTPYLEEAAGFDKSPRVRARAAQLLARRSAGRGGEF
jgi:eukaryotic-like serine/threonine-protein kinase